jgi:hypothetical protein
VTSIPFQFTTKQFYTFHFLFCTRLVFSLPFLFISVRSVELISFSHLIHSSPFLFLSGLLHFLSNPLLFVSIDLDSSPLLIGFILVLSCPFPSFSNRLESFHIHFYLTSIILYLYIPFPLFLHCPRPR